VARFSVRRVRFDRRPDADGEDTVEGLPTPARIKLAARRAAGIAEAREVLKNLPGPGESLHVVATARMDLADVLAVLLERLGPCDRVRIATLGYNRRNLATLLGWLDRGQVADVALVASKFFRSHNGDLWAKTVAEFRRRKQRAACCDSHAKVVALEFASGDRLSIERSANLCGNGSGREQFAVINDAGLEAWHAAWIKQLVDHHESEQGPSADAG
jgi:hypothetical protein